MKNKTEQRTHVILSSPLLIGEGCFRSEKISQDEARRWVQLNEPENFCGHETVRILGKTPARTRKSCAGYDQALCLSASERLEFGREYTLEEIEKIGVTFTLMTRMEDVIDEYYALLDDLGT